MSPFRLGRRRRRAATQSLVFAFTCPFLVLALGAAILFDRGVLPSIGARSQACRAHYSLAVVNCQSVIGKGTPT